MGVCVQDTRDELQLVREARIYVEVWTCVQFDRPTQTGDVRTETC